jgi:hypoxanthine phosphoribosyltransferase
MRPRVYVHGKSFVPYLDQNAIATRLQELAANIDRDYDGKNPLFLAVLNGAFMFASDLLKNIQIDCEISFVKLASYSGMQSSGQVTSLIGLSESLKDRHVVVLEDIIDTGNTMVKLLPAIEALSPASVRVCSFLLKREALLHAIEPDYVAFEVPELFFLGYGLDYDGHGRNLPALYCLEND